MKLVIWGQADCPECEDAEQEIEEFGVPYEKKSVAHDLIEQEPRLRREIMSALQFNQGALPIIQIDDYAYDLAVARRILREKVKP